MTVSETDETDDRTIDEIVDDLFDARAKIFKHVGYVEQWHDMPFEDSRDHFWSVGSWGSQIGFSPDREALIYWLEHEGDHGPFGDKLYSNEIYSGRHDAKDGIHRGAELTMICVDTNTDGNMFFQLFRNDHEVKEPETAEAVDTPLMLGVVPVPTSLLQAVPPRVIYIRTSTGSDETGDGKTEATAYQTTQRAFAEITAGAFGTTYAIDTDGAKAVGQRFIVKR
jgi:hypothetical protein